MTTVCDIYPVHDAHLGMLFHTLRHPDSGVYVEQFVWELDVDDPAFDEQDVRNVWQQLVDRHDVLRSSVVYEGLQRPQRAVHESGSVIAQVHDRDWTQLDELEARHRLDRLLAADRTLGFDLQRAPLTRFSTIRRNSRTLWVVWSLHHLLLDGWSAQAIKGEFLQLCSGHARLLERPAYRDFAVWAEAQSTDSDQEFWSGLLGDLEEPTLIGDQSAVGVGRCAQVERVFSEAETAAIVARSRELRVSLATTVQAMWARLLATHTGSRDVVFGLTGSGRDIDLPGVNDIVGLFITTSTMRVDVPDGDLVDWMKQVQSTQLGVSAHQHLALSRQQEMSGLGPGRELFDTLVVIDNYPVPQDVDGPVRLVAQRAISQTNYAATLVVFPGERLRVQLLYSSPRVTEERAAGLITEFCDLLHQLVRATSVRDLRCAPWAGAIERNPSESAAPAATLFDAFLHQVPRAPEATAIVEPGRSLTYQESEIRSRSMAGTLAAAIEPGELVAVVLPPGIDQVLIVLAIVRAGGAYLPIDADLPPRRIGQLLESAGVRRAVSSPDLPAWSVLADRWDPLSIGDLTAGIEDPDELDLPEVSADDVAYVIYTSGSTGDPKGVTERHGAAWNTIADVTSRIGLGPEDRVFALSALTFDLSVFDIFGTLGSGAALVFPGPNPMRDPALWADSARAHGVTVWNSVPALSELVAQHLEVVGDRLNLRVTMWSGDWIPVDLPARWWRVAPSSSINSLGGATEAAIWSIIHPLQRGDQYSVSVPYGRPLTAQEFYVVDPLGQPCPSGVPGELLIGGVGLAAGYWRDAKRTNERFYVHPELGRRVYRTGDLGRYLADGSIEILGRLDNQVKIRGFRVELGEIEARLRDFAGVQETAVVAYGERQDRRLFGAIVGDVDPVRAREHLARCLPDYMIPHRIDVVAAIPLSANGKVDRGALAALATRREGRELDGPASVVGSPTEELLLECCRGVLGLDAINGSDDFFELGGDSIRSVRLMSAAHKRGVRVSVAEIFEHPTMRELAALVVARTQPSPEQATVDAVAAVATVLPPSPFTGSLPLTPPQETLMLVHEVMPENRFLMGTMAYLFPSALDPAAVAWALTELAERHEIFRTTFVTGDQPRQVIGTQPMLPIQRIELTATEDETSILAELVREVAQAPVDIETGPLARAVHVSVEGGSDLVVLAIHQIVTDGTTMAVFAEEFAALYDAAVRSRDVSYLAGNETLGPVTLHHSDHVRRRLRWQDSPVGKAALARTHEYWQQRFSSEPVLRLPGALPRPDQISSLGAIEVFDFPRDLIESCKAFARARRTTPFVVCLAALVAALSPGAPDDEVLVGTVLMSRPTAELQRVAGSFSQGAFLVIDAGDNPSFDTLVKRTGSYLRDAEAHPDLLLRDWLSMRAGVGESHEVLFQFDPPMRPLTLDGPDGPTTGHHFYPERNEVDVDVAPADIYITVREREDSDLAECTYNTAIFDATTIRSLLTSFREVLRRGVTDPTTSLSELLLSGRVSR